MFQNNTKELKTCPFYQSEMKNKYQNPIMKKPAVTRANRMEQFLWHEFYEEYIRSRERLEVTQPEKPSTEYFDEFNKLGRQLVEKAEDIEIAGKVLTNKFPLYSTAAITVWNPNGEFKCNFGKSPSITLPTSEQRGQFDID